jgi:hypothetical protein
MEDTLNRLIVLKASLNALEEQYGKAKSQLFTLEGMMKVNEFIKDSIDDIVEHNLYLVKWKDFRNAFIEKYGKKYVGMLYDAMVFRFGRTKNGGWALRLRF